MKRRGFMGLILAGACAPAIVRASSLMQVVVRPELLKLPPSMSFTPSMKELGFNVGDLVTISGLVGMSVGNGIYRVANGAQFESREGLITMPTWHNVIKVSRANVLA